MPVLDLVTVEGWGENKLAERMGQQSEQWPLWLFKARKEYLPCCHHALHELAVEMTLARYLS